METSIGCVLDLRGPQAAVGLTRVAGLSLLCRHLRMAARQRWAGAHVLCDEPDRERLRRAIAEAPPPAGFEVVLGPEWVGQRSWVMLRTGAIYAPAALATAARTGAAPVVLAEVRGGADVAAAEARLRALLKKSLVDDGVVAYYVQRPMANVVTRALLRTSVSANQVTLANLVLGLGGAAVAALGSPLAFVIAGLIYWLGGVLDCVDGSLARLRVQSSRLGEVLDIAVDDLVTAAMVLGLGIGLSRAGAGAWWWSAGLGGATLAVAFRAVMYAELYRLRLPIDVAAYPWWFGSRRAGALGRVGYVLGFVVRRDLYVTLVALALAVGASRVAAAGLIVGNLAPGPLMVVHHVVLWRRARARNGAIAS